MQIGKALEQSRIKKHLSLLEVEKETKISLKYLEALEKEDFDLLPNKIYTRGFIKIYAQYLKINSEELLKEYEKISSTFPQVEPIPFYSSKKRILFKKGWIITFFFFLFLISSIILSFNIKNSTFFKETQNTYFERENIKANLKKI